MKTKTVVEHFGSQARVAKALKITESAVSRWGKIVPIRRAVILQTLTNGELAVDIKDYR